MNSTEPNPTDVLAQKRRDAEPTNARTRPHSYHVGMLRSESGRADLFRMLRDAGVWAATPASKEERREWALVRAHAAGLFALLLEEHPLQVGAMWGEAMARWNEERKNQ